MTLLDLYRRAEQEGVDVDYFPMREVVSFSPPFTRRFTPGGCTGWACAPGHTARPRNSGRAPLLP